MPLRQSLAITGSLNQHGEVQPIGGVNEKVEGFFDVCAARGLDGSQGVVIPATNLPNLMLADEVVEAARAGRFAIWAVATIDEALALLTGLPAGERGRDGSYPAGLGQRARGGRPGRPRGARPGVHGAERRACRERAVGVATQEGHGPVA